MLELMVLVGGFVWMVCKPDPPPDPAEVQYKAACLRLEQVRQDFEILHTDVILFRDYIEHGDW